jgi:methylglutaconyl-CoA hydratase
MRSLLSLCCLIVCRSYIQFSEVLRGLVPALISAVIVPQLGLYRSRQYMMSGERVAAEQLLRDGQLSELASTEAALEAAVLQRVRSLLQCAPGAAAEVKKVTAFLAQVVALCVAAVSHSALRQGHSEAAKAEYVQGLFRRMMSSAEAAHGLAAFAAKADPDWLAFALRSKL